MIPPDPFLFPLADPDIMFSEPEQDLVAIRIPWDLDTNPTTADHSYRLFTNIILADNQEGTTLMDEFSLGPCID